MYTKVSSLVDQPRGGMRAAAGRCRALGAPAKRAGAWELSRARTLALLGEESSRCGIERDSNSAGWEVTGSGHSLLGSTQGLQTRLLGWVLAVQSSGAHKAGLHSEMGHSRATHAGETGAQGCMRWSTPSGVTLGNEAAVGSRRLECPQGHAGEGRHCQ